MQSMSDNAPQFQASTSSDPHGRPNRGCPPPSSEECRQRWAAWHQAMEFSHEMLMLGLRQQVGPDGDLQAAYREWYERYQALKWDIHRAS